MQPNNGAHASPGGAHSAREQANRGRLNTRHVIMGAAFAATMALSGFLLFQVQPILAKFILPWFGGSASTWLVCSLFFQLALLVGYALAFALVRCAHHVQIGVLTIALWLCVLLLPIVPADTWKPSGADDPTFRILGLLLACVGLQFIVLAMTTPLLSSWMAGADTDLATSRFFVASNIGSFLGLLTYPFLIEHLLTGPLQARVWSWLFLAYAVLCLLCAVLARTGAARTERTSKTSDGAAQADPVMTWVALSMLGSTMMLSTANAMMQWSAVVPFLWVLPLGVYLLTFVLAFASPAAYSRLGYGLAFLVLAALTPLLVPLPESTLGLLVRIAHHTATLFFGCMICHGELVARQPAEYRLPKFYLALAGGGALGGIFVVVIAPLLFASYLEHAIGLAVVAAVVVASLMSREKGVPAGARAIVGVATILLAIGLVALVRQEMSASVEQIRNFYGVVKVVRSFEYGHDQPKLLLLQGGAEQGSQFESLERRTETTCGMDPGRGLGLALAHHAKRRADGPGTPLRLGIIGLGAGMAAGLGRPGDSISYYELNPAVHDLATRRFTLLRDSKAQIDVSIGDGRLALERELQTRGSRQFDVLVLDAFRGAAPPLHLMTREAFSTYFAHLADNGILAVNMQLDTFDVAPLTRGLAKEFRVAVGWLPSVSDDSYCQLSVSWALFTKDLRFFRSPSVRRAVAPWPDRGRSELLWTDANSNLLSIINWSRD